MKRSLNTIPIIIMMIFAGINPSHAEDQGIFNKWSLLPHKSTEIDLYQTLQIEIKKTDKGITLIQKWGKRRSYSDTLHLSLDKSKQLIQMSNRVFPTNVFMGLSMAVGSNRKIEAQWLAPQKSLQIKETFDVLASQGRTSITALHTYRLADNGETMSYTIERSTREKVGEIKYVFKRSGAREAYYIEMDDDWRIDGNLNVQAFLISLQGLANLDGPNLYFIYPETWDFTNTPHIFEFLKSDRFYTFRKLNTWKQALNTFKNNVTGYIVWDKEVRTSLIVAFTLAGLERAVVVSEEMIPDMKKAGLKLVKDFRGQFNGQNDFEIYSWAFENYWDRCTKDLIIWMGGHHGQIMKPGIADWGIYNKAFFQDLSTKPSDKKEYELANTLLSELNPMSMVMGWHSYKKDKERDHVRLTSSYGHRIRGLHTAPNMSFISQVPKTPGFVFKNNHNIDTNKTYKPEKKVYVTCVQTDGVGLGAWVRPGRGEIPYAWVLEMTDYDLAPAILEYYYTQATPNDYFVGGVALGYMYAKAIPNNLRPFLFSAAQKRLKELDLCITQTMDYSEGATVEGNTELTKDIVDGFYKHLPDVIGFCNGYAPAFTFAEKNGIPVVSYDYYLSRSRSIKDAVSDLRELATINKKRPYFLLAHIRQYSDIERVKSILDQLGPEFEVVPLDIFMKLAGQNPTFKERYLERE